MKIGANIKKLRIRAGLTQQQLARKIEVTPSAVCNYETDISFPKSEILYKIFYALRTSPNELFGYSPMESEEVRRHMEKFKKLDEIGRENVDRFTDSELERKEGIAVRIAARNGDSDSEIQIKKQSDKQISNLPDYNGGRK